MLSTTPRELPIYILKQRVGEWPPFFQIGTDMGEWDLLGTPPRGQVVAAASARCAVLTVVHMVETQHARSPSGTDACLAPRKEVGDVNVIG